MARGDRYYHTVRGKRRLCRLWLPPDSDAYWHMCGDPEVVVALSVPTRGGIILLDVKGYEHARKVEGIMKELEARATSGNIWLGDFDEETSSEGEVHRAIDWLLRDLGAAPKEHHALAGYAEYAVHRAMGPRGGRPRPASTRRRRPVHVRAYPRQR